MILLDDYDFVIEMDFLDRINDLIVPVADCIFILESKCQGVVSVKHLMGNGQKTLLTMQLKKGVRKGEFTYLALVKID